MSTATRALCLGGLLACAGADAANPPFQSFFFNVCANPTGALAQRCAETPNAGGDLSGDSESSLNPSQTLGISRAQVDAAQRRDDQAPDAYGSLEIGPWALRVAAHGARFERDRGFTDAEERGIDGDSRGLDLGVDYRLSDAASLGAVLGVERSDADFAAENPGTNFTPQRNAGSADIDLTMLSLVASFAVGSDGYVILSGGYGRSDGEFRRTSVFQESTRTLTQRNTDVRGRADGSLGWLGIDGGRDFVREDWTYGLYGGLTWSRSATDAYSEVDVNGAGLAMRFEGIERGSLLGVLGGSVGYTVSTGTAVWVPQLRAQWQREFDDDAETVDASFLLDASGTRYRLQGERPDRSHGELGFSVVGVFGGGWNAFFDYSRLLARDDFERDRISVGVTRDF
jgi:hypothetical protein